MVDTMKIYCTFKTIRDYSAVLNCIIRATKEKKIHIDKRDPNSLVTYAYAKQGFEEIKMRNNRKGFLAIEIKLRPKLLVDKFNYINVLHENEISFVRNQFNWFLRTTLKADLPDFFSWKVKRIDYAIDINIKQCLIPVYMILFSMGNIPEYAFKDSATREYIKAINNCYIRCKGYTVNFYDRYTTLLDKQGKSKKNYLNIESARNLMRFEIQIKVNAYRLKSKNRISENTVREFMSSDQCKHYIQHHFNTIIGSGDYYTLEKAKALIFAKSKSLTSAMQLKKIVELIHSKGSTYKAKESYLKYCPDRKKASKKFSNYINTLRRMGINQVTIPSDLSKTLKTDILEGLRYKIDDYFEASRNKYSQTGKPVIYYYNERGVNNGK